MTNPNSTAEDVKEHINYIFWQKDIQALDPTDPTDAEYIVREFMKNTHTTVEIEQELEDAKTFGRLTQKAEMYKPKLVAKIQNDLNTKVARQQQVLDMENQLQADFITKVKQVLDKGSVNNIPLGNEERSKLWGIFNSTKIPVPVPGGKTVEMGYINYLIAKKMYAQDSTPEDMDSLLLAALILEGGTKVLNKYIAAPAIKQEVAKFRTQGASGGFRSTPTPTKTQETKGAKLGFFDRKLR
jgi:hypothetical protein